MASGKTGCSTLIAFIAILISFLALIKAGVIEDIVNKDFSWLTGAFKGTKAPPKEDFKLLYEASNKKLDFLKNLYIEHIKQGLKFGKEFLKLESENIENSKEILLKENYDEIKNYISKFDSTINFYIDKIDTTLKKGEEKLDLNVYQYLFHFKILVNLCLVRWHINKAVELTEKYKPRDAKKNMDQAMSLLSKSGDISKKIGFDMSEIMLHFEMNYNKWKENPDGSLRELKNFEIELKDFIDKMLKKEIKLTEK